MASPSNPTPQPFPYDEPLRRLMTQAEILSYRALSQRSGVSRSSLNQLRRGQIRTMRLETLQRLSQTLGGSVADLIAQFANPVANPVADSGATPAPSPDAAATLATLRQEYGRLQQQIASQDQTIRQQVQREALTRIESWLVMWPNAVQAAEDKPDLPASKILPLTRPLQDLLQTWAVRPIGKVGEVVAYDPHLHQLEVPLPPGAKVRVRNVGYWHGDCLLHRARVIPAD